MLYSHSPPASCPAPSLLQSSWPAPEGWRVGKHPQSSPPPEEVYLETSRSTCETKKSETQAGHSRRLSWSSWKSKNNTVEVLVTSTLLCLIWKFILIDNLGLTTSIIWHFQRMHFNSRYEQVGTWLPVPRETTIPNFLMSPSWPWQTERQREGQRNKRSNKTWMI